MEKKTNISVMNEIASAIAAAVLDEVVKSPTTVDEWIVKHAREIVMSSLGFTLDWNQLRLNRINGFMGHFVNYLHMLAKESATKHFKKAIQEISLDEIILAASKEVINEYSEAYHRQLTALSSDYVEAHFKNNNETVVLVITDAAAERIEQACQATLDSFQKR